MHLPLNLDPSRAASDIRITAIYTAPSIERRRQAAAILWESDWQRIATEADLAHVRPIAELLAAAD